MDGNELEQKALFFNKALEQLKKDIDPNFKWYPYRTLKNFEVLKILFNKYSLEKLIGPEFKTLDIGAADGDMAFFLESLGYHADIIDFPPTNFNQLKGARLLKDALKSNVNIYERDLDSQFPGLNENYGLIFFLGILYHLKNPYYVLETLQRYTKNLVISTRIAKRTKDGTKIYKNSLAYLLGPAESNNDSTNYWIFSQKGLERLFERTGWEITEMISIGDTRKSNPSDQHHDERAFALLKSKF